MLKLKRNMGTLDRSLRLVVGTILLIVGPLTNVIELAAVLEAVLAGLGLVAILSAIFSYCPLYEFTGSDTSK